MNGADIVLTLVVVVSMASGLIRGFVREAVSLAFLIGGLYAAWRLGPDVEPHLGGYLALPAVRPWVARLAVFLAMLLAGAVIGALSSYLLRSAGLGAVDRAVGVLFGALRGAVFVGLLVICGELLQLNRETWWNRSILIPYGEVIGDQLRAMVGETGAAWRRRGRLSAVDIHWTGGF